MLKGLKQEKTGSSHFRSLLCILLTLTWYGKDCGQNPANKCFGNATN